MLKILNENKQQVALLTSFLSMKVTKAINSTEQLEFTIAASDNAKYEIKPERYLLLRDGNEYLIKEVTESFNEVSVVAITNIEDLLGRAFKNFETLEQTLHNTMSVILNNTGYSFEIHFESTKRRTLKKWITNSYELLKDAQKVFRFEYHIDANNKVIHLYDTIGEDKGSFFMSKLNLISLNKEEHTHDLITRIYPIGKDGLTIKEVNHGLDYVENREYKHKIIEAYWEDNRYTDATSLYEDAVAKLKELSKPYISYKIKVSRLGNNTYNLGDTIHIISKEQNIKLKQRVVKLVEYPLTPDNNECEIANSTLTFEQLQAERDDILNSMGSVVNEDNTIDGSKIDNIPTTAIPDTVYHPNLIYNSSFERFNEELKPDYWETTGTISSQYQAHGNHSLYLTRGQYLKQKGITGNELLDTSKWSNLSTLFKFRALGNGTIRVSVWSGDNIKQISADGESTISNYINFDITSLNWVDSTYSVELGPSTDTVGLKIECMTGYVYIDAVEGHPLTPQLKNVSYQDGPKSQNDLMTIRDYDLTDAPVGTMWFRR